MAGRPSGGNRGMTPSAGQSKLLGFLAAGFESSLSSMTGKAFSVSVEPASAAIAGDESRFVWQQELSIASEPALWISAGEDFWMAAGRMTLSALGVEEASSDDSRSTWQEILGQALGALATALSAESRQEVTTTSGKSVDAEPPGLSWFSLRVRCETAEWCVRVAWSDAVIHTLVKQEQLSANALTSLSVKNGHFSKTFDLLLDVALPVAVSFGKTSLQIREVLKLNTGSIVELDRLVTEPVDVIVNECVIARGEVVVVDGNYGVRITQLASREDRLRTGMAELPARAGAHK